ncbi:M23 family metallopeptidase [Propionibacteriaceae bacterium Y1923]
MHTHEHVDNHEPDEGATTRVGRCAVVLVAVLASLLGVLVTAPPPPALAEERLAGINLLPPVDGGVLRAFQRPLTQYGPGHRGVDLAAGIGQPVRAGAAGVVTFAGMVAGRGVVTINHGNGVDTTYEPLHAQVTTGARVEAGELLGTLSSGGHGTGLHWGLRRGGQYYDPMLHLAATASSSGPVRLLPLSAEPRPPQAALVPQPGGAAGGGIPVSGPVTSPFGMRFHPILKVWKLHDGVDFGAPCGTPVRAVGAGTVVLVDQHPAYGNRVIVEVGGGRRHGYTHLGGSGVRVGQQVGAGGFLGTVGSTGYSTGCHLHFMAWQDGRVVNPL